MQGLYCDPIDHGSEHSVNQLTWQGLILISHFDGKFVHCIFCHKAKHHVFLPKNITIRTYHHSCLSLVPLALWCHVKTLLFPCLVSFVFNWACRHGLKRTESEKTHLWHKHRTTDLNTKKLKSSRAPLLNNISGARFTELLPPS